VKFASLGGKAFVTEKGNVKKRIVSGRQAIRPQDRGRDGGGCSTAVPKTPFPARGRDEEGGFGCETGEGAGKRGKIGGGELGRPTKLRGTTATRGKGEMRTC